ncbi:N-terminal methionine N(alpha)-acetyltransferase NatE [Salvia divinorum]|uniref:N-terminal methionine N(Alpha)-acetyltransferase NatE n=1 Tax=Salvia divinorum TaxID=28513 RepID=A0ABD1IGB8_SALDI
MSTIALHTPNFSRRWTIVSCATKGQQCLRQINKSSPREAQHDDEYWIDGRSVESQWEGQQNERYAESNRRKFAQQEFNAMTRRYNANLEKNCICIIVMVNNENGGVKSESVAGTLDLSIQHLSHGETFPREWLMHPLLRLLDTKPSTCYGYIANLCIAKYARRQGVASSMLEYAISVAKSNATSFQLSAEQTILLCLELSTSGVRFPYDVSNG